MSGEKTPKSPKSPNQTPYQRYSWVIEEPLSVLPNRMLNQLDILRHWLYISYRLIILRKTISFTISLKTLVRIENIFLVLIRPA